MDAVYIATPPYLHPEHFETAVKARKHIFMEKPAGVDAAGCQRVLEAAKKADQTKRITVDYQQRYGKDYRQGVRDREVRRAGRRSRWCAQSWIGGGLPVRTGHAASEEKMRNWLFYREHSGDIIVEQNCHNLDVVNWFMGTHPVKATGYGGRAVRKDIGNIMDNLAVHLPVRRRHGVQLQRQPVRAGGFRTSPRRSSARRARSTTRATATSSTRDKPDKTAPPVEVGTNYDITQDAVNEFIEGARTGKIENAAFTAAESTLTAIMAREAIYTGREMTWEKLVGRG